MLALCQRAGILIFVTNNPPHTHMHPAPQNCSVTELFLYSATRVYLKTEVRSEGHLVMSKNARPNAITLLNAHAGTSLKKSAKAKEVLDLFDLHFGQYLPQR